MLSDQIRETIKCRNNFPYFCENYVKIYHPLKGILNFKLYDFQIRVFNEYQTHRFNIVRKFRQGGLSTMTAIYALWQILFFTDRSIFVASLTDREAMEFHKIILRAYDALPDWMRGQSLTRNQHELILDTGGSITCLTPSAGRGFAKGLLVVDEAAFIDRVEDFWGRVYPIISTGGRAIVISTVNGMGNWYHQTWVGAENKTNRFNPIYLNYTEHPDYRDPVWVEQTRANIGEKKWRQEVLGEFLGSANTYLPAEVINFYLENAKEPIQEKIDGCLRIWEEPKPNHLYVIGGDPSEGLGEGSDFSCAQVLDLSTLRQVAEFYSNEHPPSKFSQVLALLGKQYNHASLVVENNGMGVAVLDDLFEQIHYENIFTNRPLGVNLRKSKRGFNTNVKTRAQMQEHLYHVLTNRIVTLHSKRLATELQTWLFNPQKQKAEHMRGYHDDAIRALGLALIAREEIIRNAPPYLDLAAQARERNLDSKEAEPVSTPVSTYIEDGELKEAVLGEPPLEEEVHEPPLEPQIMIHRPNEDLMKEFGW